MLLFTDGRTSHPPLFFVLASSWWVVVSCSSPTDGVFDEAGAIRPPRRQYEECTPFAAGCREPMILTVANRNMQRPQRQLQRYSAMVVCGLIASSSARRCLLPFEYCLSVNDSATVASFRIRHQRTLCVVEHLSSRRKLK